MNNSHQTVAEKSYELACAHILQAMTDKRGNVVMGDKVLPVEQAVAECKGWPGVLTTRFKIADAVEAYAKSGVV